MNFFKPENVTAEKTKFKHTPVGIAAPNLPLEKTVSLKLNGKYGNEIYEKYIKGKL